MLEKNKINRTIDAIINSLKESGRIDDKYIEDFKKSFDSQFLKIGVVGKMKAGKSSLVNAIVFGADVLPTGSEPVTVTLTEISYSDNNEDSAEIEFITEQDVKDLKEQIAYTGTDENLLKKKANAQETLDNLPHNYDQMINRGKEKISLERLQEYVSSSGKFSGLAKFVHVYKNNENLKGLEIIDTPGFNDPISSRGEATKNFLGKCHVVLFVHNEDGYDQTDCSLLSDQIEYAGISELVDVFNRVDILDIPLNAWDEQLEYLLERRKEYFRQLPSNGNVEHIISKSHAVITSSLMALCGLIDRADRTPFIKQSISRYEEMYNELCEPFQNETLEDRLVKFSNINKIISDIDRIGRNSTNYLLEGPLMTIKGKLESIVETINSDIEECQAKIDSLSTSYETAQNDLREMESFMREMRERILGNDLNTQLQSLVNDTYLNLCKDRLEDASKEFTEEQYPDPVFGSRGVTKQNIGNYNTFVTSFESKLRNYENNLVSSFRSHAKENIRSMVSSLVNVHISEPRRKIFEIIVQKGMFELIDELILIIDSHVISNIPVGNQKQWSLLKTNFFETFDDNYFNSELKQFRDQAKDISDPGLVIAALQHLEDELRDEMQTTPIQKEHDMREAANMLNALKIELADCKGFISNINNFLN